MIKNCFVKLLVIVIIIIMAPCVLSLGSFKKFHHVIQWKNWEQAQHYCREHHTDLATARSQEDEDMLPGNGWIGMRRETGLAAWRWSDGGRSLSFTNWAPGQPENHSCASVSTASGKWYSGSCWHYHSVFCLKNDNFYHVMGLKNWYDAQSHCRNNGGDLVTIQSAQDGEKLNGNHRAWTGLYEDHQDSVWKWSGGQSSAYRNWAPRQPVQQNCVLSHQGKWYSEHCYAGNFFICYEDKLVLVRENKTWEEALEHCRSISVDAKQPDPYRNYLFDLLSLRSKEDHLYAREKIQGAVTDRVWTGLRFLAGRWLWVDGEPLEGQDLPLCPAQWQHCGTLPKRGSTRWEAQDCTERRNFLCFSKG